MPTLTEIPIRFAFDVQSRTAAEPIGSADDVIIYRGNPFVIQAAAFNGTPASDTFVDVSNVTLANLVIRANDSQGPVLIEKVLDDTDVDAALVYADWTAGNGQQFSFSLSDTDTNQDVPSDGNLDIYGVLSIVTDSGEITLGFFQGVIQEDGIGNPTSPDTPDYTTYSREEINVLISGHLSGMLDFSDISGTLSIDQLPAGTVVSIDSIGENAFYFFDDSTFTPQLLSKADALEFLLPDQTSHTGEFLQTDGSGTLSWAAASGSGDITTDTAWDAKGDLIGGTGANTAAKLTVGANDTMLMADSAQTTGLKWASPLTVRTALGLVIGTNVQAFDADLSTLAGLTATTDNFIISVSSAWASRTPAQARTTLGLVIGTNVQAWDADLDAVAALTTDSFGLALLTKTSAANIRSYIGAGTSSFDGAFSSLTGTPTTLSGYGITDAQPLDSDLTTIAGLTATTDNFIVSVSSAWASRTPAQVRTTLGLVIGTNVQAWDADLDTLAGLTATTNNFIVSVSSAWASRTPTQVRTTLALTIGTDVQAWDADLDALAALSGTNNIYYRSAANTWSSVTVGSGLDFTTGTLSATGGSADKLGLTPTAVKTSAYTAVAGDFVPVDTTSGTVVITLTTAPADGAVVAIKHIIQSGSNVVTVNTGGSDVFNKAGGSTTGSLSLLNQSFVLQYKSSSAIWYIVCNDTTLSSLDLRYQPLDSDLTTIAGLTATTDNFIVSVSSAWASRTPSQVRTTLGLVIGTNVQAWDADLDTLAGLTATTDNFIVSVSSAWASRTPTQVKTTLGLVIGTNVQAWDADLDTLAGLTATTDNFIVSVSSAWASRTPAQVRTTLALVIGTNVQAWDADLDSWAAITRASGFDTFTATPSSANLRSLLTDELGTGAALFDGCTLTALLTTATCGSSLASINIPAGTVPTTPNDGDVFADANCFYGCTDAGNAGYIPVVHIIRADSTVTQANDANAHAIFTTPANGRLTLETGTYRFHGAFEWSSMSATSGNLTFSMLGAGTATTGSWHWFSIGHEGAIGSTTTFTGQFETGSATGGSNWVTASTNAVTQGIVDGTFEVTGAGTIIPTQTLTTAAAAVLAVGSYLEVWRIGSTSMTSVGQWD